MDISPSSSLSVEASPSRNGSVGLSLQASSVCASHYKHHQCGHGCSLFSVYNSFVYLIRLTSASSSGGRISVAMLCTPKNLHMGANSHSRAATLPPSPPTPQIHYPHSSHPVLHALITPPAMAMINNVSYTLLL